MRALDRSAIAWAVVAVVCCVSSPFAADQTLLGRRLLLRSPGLVDPYRRSIQITAHEKQSTNTLTGDPTSAGSGGTIMLTIDGSTYFGDVLLQGVSPSGTAYWAGSASSQFQYTDSKGVNGAVTKAKIKRTGNGTFTVQVRISGKHGFLPGPPLTFTSGCAALTLGFGATEERYSILFGSESEVAIEPGRLEAKNPTVEGNCPQIACGSATYPSCGGTCGAGEVCRPLSGHPNSFDPSGTCACVAAGGPTDCPAGNAYQVGGDQNNVPIGCSPVPTCNDVQLTGYSSCAGGVAPGAVCQPMRIIDYTFGIDTSVCVPYPATETCDSFCSLSGGGVCQSGEACAVSGGFDGMDCGCFTPPFCFADASCGAGSCPDGSCITCPPEVCGPSPVCFCSSD